MEHAICAFDRRLDPGLTGPIGVAFSGGGDSLAALLAAKAWADRHGRRVLALTVDHRLQPQSADWTRWAGETARRLGADFRALAWDTVKPAAGLAAAARLARHSLIAEAARAAGARVVVFGHTADDILEADLMRAEGSTLGFLREWGPSPAWPEGRGVFLLRPLLTLRRAAIREALRAAGESWIDDPANDDPKLTRSWARKRLAQSPDQTAGADSIPSPVGRRRGPRCEASWEDEGVRSVRTVLKHRTPSPSQASPGPLPLPTGEVFQDDVAALALKVTAGPGGFLRIDRSVLQLARPGAARRVLSAALLSVGGGERPPRGERLDRLMTQIAGDGAFCATLAGAKVVAGEELLILREAGRGRLAPVRLVPDAATVWDGRFEFTARTTGSSVHNLAGHMADLDRGQRRTLRTVPAPARPGLPVVIDDDGQLTCPILADQPSVDVRSLVAARFLSACGAISKEPAD